MLIFSYGFHYLLQSLRMTWAESSQNSAVLVSVVLFAHSLNDMPCVLKVKIFTARDLPIMDRKSELTDAYVEVKFGDLEVQRTQVQRKTLNPTWNEDFRFEVSDDADLQNEPLELRVFDYDVIINDMIGSIFIDLNPLLTWDSAGQIAGWFPVYDTLRNLQGELNVQVKLQFFGDVNPFKESSAGVQFFSMTRQPPAYQIVGMYGLVDDLVTEDDPEYHWSDSFRTPRASNEARQRLLFQLSGQLRRKVGQKVLQMGGNAVLGYKQCFDLENEEKSITARAIGTTVKLAPVVDPTTMLSPIEKGVGGLSLQSPVLTYPPSQNYVPESVVATELIPVASSANASATTPLISAVEEITLVQRDVPLHSQLSESPQHARQNSLDASTLSGNASNFPRTRNHHDYTILDQQILTMHDFPAGAILHLGGIVSARSVKLIENDSAEVRDSWWTELRDEIKSHARTLGCPHVIGYTEITTINDELCVLSAAGTAAIVDMAVFAPRLLEFLDGPAGGNMSDSANIGTTTPMSDSVDGGGAAFKSSYASSFIDVLAKRRRSKKQSPSCRMCHIPYSRKSAPFPMGFVRCGCCKRRYVPEIMLGTIEPPPELEIIGQPCFVEAHVCRPKKRKEGESNAGIVSDAVPFIEYDIHRQLMYKLKIQGMNAIFGLRIHLAVGEGLIVAVACGTAFYLSALPTPPAIRIARNLDVVDDEDKKLLELQSKLMERSEANRRALDSAYRARRSSDASESSSDEGARGEGAKGTERAGVGRAGAGAEESDSDESSSGSDAEEGVDQYQHNAIVQIDDDADEDLMAVLWDPMFTNGFQICNTESLPGHPYLSPNVGTVVPSPARPDDMHLITTVKQGNISALMHHPNRQLASIFRNLYEELRFRLSYFEDCVVAGVHYDVQLPNKTNEIQIRVTAVAMGRYWASDLSAFEALVSPAVAARSLPSSSGVKKSAEEEVVGPNAQKNANKEGRIEDQMVFEMEDDQNQGRIAVSLSSAILPSTVTPSPSLPSATSSSSVSEPASQPASVKSSSAHRRRPSLGSLGSIISHTLHVVKNAATASSSSTSSQATTPTAANTLSRDSFDPATLTTPVPFIEMTPLPYIPGATALRYLGRLSLHFVKEAHIVHEVSTAGIGSFVNAFLMEIQAVARAHVAALGGNAIVGYHVDQTFFEENMKSQGYALMSLSGDVIECRYEDEAEVAAGGTVGSGWGLSWVEEMGKVKS